jgi:membrane protein
MLRNDVTKAKRAFGDSPPECGYPHVNNIRTTVRALTDESRGAGRTWRRLLAAASSVGLGGLPARLVSFAVGTILGFGFFLALFRVAAAAQVPTRSLLLSAAVSAIGWQLLLIVAGYVVAHQLRHAQAVAGLFGAVLGLLAWLALQATVIVYAIETDVVRVKHLWPRSIVQPPLTKADKAYYTDRLRAEAQRPEQQLDIAYEKQPADPC